MSHAVRLVAALVLFAFAGPLAAQATDPKPESKSEDEKLYNTLRDVINKGADLYNGGEPAACYRLFEGALMTIKPTLDRYPDLQKEIAKGLAGAEKDPVMWRRAFTLRSVMDKVRAEVNPKKKAKDKLPDPKTDDKKDEKKEEKKDG
jgi:hypothetical protein